MAKTQENKGVQELNEALSKSEAFIKKYKKALIAAIIALIVIVAGIIFYNHYKTNRSIEASTAIASAQELMGQQQYEKALKGNGATVGLLQVADEYSGTDAGNLANYYAGLCYAKLEKWDEAVNYLEKFSPKADLIVSPLSQVALGDAYANKKRYDDAVAAYKKGAKLADKAAESGKNNAVSPIALKKAGIILYEQGNKAEALKVFQEIKEKYVNAPIVAGDMNQYTGQMTPPEIDKYIELVSE